MKDLQAIIRNVPDFPKAGIMFKDITPLLQDGEAFQQAIDRMAASWADKQIDVVVGIEARGFIFASALAYKLGAGLVIVRKPGKLPYKTKTVTYALEYGTDSLQIHDDAIAKGQRVLIVDDVLATGGTVKGVTELIQQFDATIAGIAFLSELSFLNGREKLQEFEMTSVISF